MNSSTSWLEVTNFQKSTTSVVGPLDEEEYHPGPTATLHSCPARLEEWVLGEG